MKNKYIYIKTLRGLIHPLGTWFSALQHDGNGNTERGSHVTAQLDGDQGIISRTGGKFRCLTNLLNTSFPNDMIAYKMPSIQPLLLLSQADIVLNIQLTPLRQTIISFNGLIH